nr:MAG TPA: hypothetical protein [Caudoviricetes sp.]
MSTFKERQIKSRLGEQVLSAIENLPGYKIDYFSSTPDNIVLIKDNGMRWEDLDSIEGYYINGQSEIVEYREQKPSNNARCVFPTYEDAEASLAMAQLLQLRNHYNKGIKFEIGQIYEEKLWYVHFNSLDSVEYDIQIGSSNRCYSSLTFVNEETARIFVREQSELLYKAKPFL